MSRNYHSTYQCRFVVMVSFVVLMVVSFSVFCSDTVVMKKLRIVVTTEQLRTIVSAIAGDDVEVDSLSNDQHACAHSFHITPKSMKKIQNASLIIYIGQNFDDAIMRYVSKDAHIFNISKTPHLEFLGKNYHFWLSHKNLMLIISAIYDKLISMNEYSYGELHINYRKLLANIKLNEASIQQINRNVVVVSDSIEYMHSSTNERIFKFILKQHPSIKAINMLRDFITDHKIDLIVSDHHNYAQIKAHFRDIKVVLMNDIDILNNMLLDERSIFLNF